MMGEFHGQVGAAAFLAPKGRHWYLRRAFRFAWQRFRRGWDDSETWNLDADIARWVLPRLRRFRELPHGHPGHLTADEYEVVLAELEWFFGVHASDRGVWQLETDELRQRYSRAQELLGRHFGDLWS